MNEPQVGIEDTKLPNILQTPSVLISCEASTKSPDAIVSIKHSTININFQLNAENYFWHSLENVIFKIYKKWDFFTKELDLELESNSVRPIFGIEFLTGIRIRRI